MSSSTMVADFEPHRGCWLLWPFRDDVWRENAVPAQRVFCDLMRAIVEFEPVTLGVVPERFEEAKAVVDSRVSVVQIEYDDAWIRDTGPLFVREHGGSLRGVACDFNAWGGLEQPLYGSWEDDRRIAERLLAHEGFPSTVEGFVLEGGAIQSDGIGTLVATESIILNPNRNPGVTRRSAEDFFKSVLGIEKVIWLRDGLTADETGGHVDNVCAFIDEAHVVISVAADCESPDYGPTQDALDVLRSATDAQGRPIRVTTLPLPVVPPLEPAEAEGLRQCDSSKPRLAGDNLAASYVNFYQANGAVIMPVFGVKEDADATRRLAEATPGRRILTIPGRELLIAGGGPHCVTRDIPLSGCP